MAESEFAPVTPGEMLKEEFLAEYGLSQSQLAKAVGISPNRIAEIVNNRRRITADIAGVDRIPPRPTSTRPKPLAAARRRIAAIASRLW